MRPIEDPATSLQEQLARMAEREAATRNVLNALVQSREDETPVFDIILESASRICGASSAALMTVSPDGRFNELRRRYGELAVQPAPLLQWPLESEQAHAVAVRRGETVHEPDLRQSDLYKSGDPTRVQLVDKAGLKSALAVPLIRQGEAIGVIVVHHDARAFTDEEIALVETFAAQAVIAIENVGQFRALQTRLEREAATGKVLGVINQSRDDETPVFEVILESAARLCNAPFADLDLLDADGKHLREVATLGETVRKIPSDEWHWSIDQPNYPVVAVRKGEVVHVPDLSKSENYLAGNQMTVASVEVEKISSLLAVPLLAQGKCLGCIVLFRQEVAPFSPDEIALVETFAAQAVIAIENVRQFRALQTRLAREAASRDILQIISENRRDDAPVFDAILSHAARLCDAPMAWLLLLNDDRTQLSLAGYHGVSRRALEIGQTWPYVIEESMTGLGHALADAQSVQDDDLAQAQSYLDGAEDMRQLVDEEGLRTRVSVPLVQDGQAIGVIVLSRREVSPFSAEDIRLVDTFSEQAVIAVENVRQFRELETRLEREQASTEVLEVISQSRDDDQRVFETLLERAVSLSQSAHGSVWLVDRARKWLEVVARNEADAAQRAGFDRRRLDDSDSAAATCVREQSMQRIDDLLDLPGYSDPDFRNQEWISGSGARSVLLVPLVSGDVSIGMLGVYRNEVKPYRQEHVALIQGFAAQAVIAIENTRQFRALEALNAELGDRVEEQVGEIERMGRLKRFLPPAVADTVISQGSDQLLTSHRALLGVLFCDIRGFTAFCETAEPEETIEVLQTYHEEMGKLINAHGAGVDHRMGDGIMVLFNDPLPCDDPAGEATRLAIAMRTRMAELCKGWKRMGYRLGFGVGVSLGYATVGMVGFEGRFDYTASGTAVNLASRLCDEAEDGEILLSPRASIAVEEDHPTETRGEISLKGIREPVEVFRLL